MASGAPAEALPTPADAVPAELLALVKPHVDSYDEFLNVGLARVSASIRPLRVPLPGGLTLTAWLDSLSVGAPLRQDARAGELVLDHRLLPRECRQVRLRNANGEARPRPLLHPPPPHHQRLTRDASQRVALPTVARSPGACGGAWATATRSCWRPASACYL